MKFLLDTDAISFFYDAARIPEHQIIQRHLSKLQEEDVLQISVLTLYEFEYSYFNATTDQQEQIRNTIRKIETTFEVIALKREFALIYGEIKYLLRHSTGRKPKEMKKYNIDLMIASTSVAEASTLIGADSIYEEISNLYPRFKTENWLIR